MSRIKLADVNEFTNNPRVITKAQYELLQETMDELGDISGIVHDENSNQLVGGNQRSKILKLADATIVIVKEFDPPTQKGTTAYGYVEFKGEEWAYRRVNWTADQCAKANIVANKAGGTFDFDMLANNYELEFLYSYGFQSYEFGMKGKSEPEPEKPEELGEGFVYFEITMLEGDRDFLMQVTGDIMKTEQIESRGEALMLLIKN